MPPTNIIENASTSMRLPFRNSRARFRRPRHASQRQSVHPATTENKSHTDATNATCDTSPLPISNLRSAGLRKVSMWQHESGVIDVLCPAPDDIILTLMHIKGVLRTAIDESKLSKELLIPSEQAEHIPFIIDQILAHTHVAAAASLSCGWQRSGIATDLLNTRLPGSHNPGTSAQELYAQDSEVDFMIEGTSHENHCLNRLWAMQSLWKETPWGTMKAEIHVLGDRLHSEILHFRVCFSPNPQLSSNGLVIDYISHHITSFVDSDCQPAQPDRQPWNISEVIKFAPLFYITRVVVKNSEYLLQLAEEFISRIRWAVQQVSDPSKPLDRLFFQKLSQACQSLEKFSECISAMSHAFSVNSLT